MTSDVTAARLSGHSELVEYYEYQQKADAAWDKAYSEFESWCARKKIDPDDDDAFSKWIKSDDISSKAEGYLDDYLKYDDKADEALYDAYEDEYDKDEDDLKDALAAVTRTGTALWSAVIALFVGLFLGIGEGVYYGSKEKAVKYALIGAGVSLAIGFVSGYLAQWMYAEMLADDPEDFAAAFVRGLGWAIMGLGIGTSVGLIKPEKKRMLFCALGGLVGAFVGGFLFNYVCDIIPNDVVARGVAIVIMGILIGVGVGLLEQFAKAAWLKVIAVLIVKDAQFPYLDIADLSTMKTGDDIYAIGAPHGMAYTLTKGGISAKERMVGNQSYIQIDAPINQGNSGDPLLNDAGQVLGMNTLKMSDSEGIGLAISISRVCEYLMSLGIELNTNGNVVDSVEIPEETKPSETKPGGNDESKEPSDDQDNERRTPAITYIAVVVAALSLAANVVLVVLLINEKKKSSVAPYDPSERTDFDIDILE